MPGSIGCSMITGSGALGCAACQASTCWSMDARVFCSATNALASASRGLVLNRISVGKPMFGFSAFPA